MIKNDTITESDCFAVPYDENFEQTVTFHKIVTPFHDLCVAVDYESTISYTINDTAIIELYRKGKSRRAQWHIGDYHKQKSDWGDSIKRAVALLGLRGKVLRKGLIASINDDDSYEFSILSLVCESNGLKTSKEEIVDILAESDMQLTGYCNRNYYLAQANQSCVYDGEIIAKRMPECNQGENNYDVLNAASYVLKAFAGVEYGEYKNCTICDITGPMFTEYGDKLPEVWQSMVERWFIEKRMAKRARDAIVNNEIEEFKLICGVKNGTI